MIIYVHIELVDWKRTPTQSTWTIQVDRHWNHRSRCFISQKNIDYPFVSGCIVRYPDFFEQTTVMCQSESPASNLPWQIVDRSEYQDPQEQSLCCLLRVQTSTWIHWFSVDSRACNRGVFLSPRWSLDRFVAVSEEWEKETSRYLFPPTTFKVTKYLLQVVPTRIFILSSKYFML